MRLFIIRHGQSHNNLVDFNAVSHEEYVTSRLPDPDLTPLGWRQAEAVAQHVATAKTVDHAAGYGIFDRPGYGITRLYCSPMRRAMQTAQPIGKAIGVDPEINVDIYEFGGMYSGDHHEPEKCLNHPGMTSSEIEKEFPGYIIPATITEDGWYKEGHESYEYFTDRIKRAARFLQKMAAESNSTHQTHEHVALVVHADFIDHLLKALLEQPVQPNFSYLFHNTSITLLEFSSTGRIRVGFVNRSEHLTEDVFTESD